jgi:hypothetical protein
MISTNTVFLEVEGTYYKVFYEQSFVLRILANEWLNGGRYIRDLIRSKCLLLVGTIVK